MMSYWSSNGATSRKYKADQPHQGMYIIIIYDLSHKDFGIIQYSLY